jgi:hypothetical protein
MHRIDDPTAVPTLPAPRPAGTPGYFTGGSPGSGGFLATVVRYEFMNALQEEIAAVVESAGMTLDKTNNAQLLAALRRLYRIPVTADMTIYVNPTTGNDSNDGLSPSTAFLTIQAAINNVYYVYDWHNHGCTIQLADGTYNYSVANGYAANFNGTPFGMEPFQLTLQGNAASPGNVIINATNANCLQVFGQGTLTVTGVTFTATGTIAGITTNQGLGLVANNGAWVYINNCHFGSCGQTQVSCIDGSVVVVQAGATSNFTGNTQTSLYVAVGGQLWLQGATMNVTGLTVSDAFIFAQECGTCNGITATFIGSATGSRYNVFANGVIQTGGGGATYFPGSAAGITGSGGQYV